MSSEVNSWQWSELDPVTRSVVAAFAWRIGDETRGDLSGEGFVDAMTEAFDHMTDEDVTKAAGWGGPEGTRNTIVNQLSSFEREQITRVTQHLGHLAGGTEAMVALATQAGEQLNRGSGYDAIPALRVLSELAMGKR